MNNSTFFGKIDPVEVADQKWSPGGILQNGILKLFLELS